MDLQELATQAKAIEDVVVGLANAAAMAEHVLVSSEHLALELLKRAVYGGHPEPAVLSTLAPLFKALVTTAENYELPLSTETEAAIARFQRAGISIAEAMPRLLSRPLALAPEGPGEYSVFVDESGSASFDEDVQPVLTLVGIIIKDDLIPELERRADSLLFHRGLPVETEFHAQELLVASPEGPLGRLDPTSRYELLRDFVTLGMRDVHVHYLSMRKAEVKPEFREKMIAQGMNAYSHTVVWFVLTLDRGSILVRQGLAPYKYFYDRTDAYRKDIGRIFRALKQTTNKRLQLIGIKGKPTMLESHQSRCIQLADVVGYFLSRYRQFETPASKPRPELEKHEAKIREMYALIQPRRIDFIGKDLHITVDWKALQDFSLKGPPKPLWRPPVGRDRR